LTKIITQVLSVDAGIKIKNEEEKVYVLLKLNKNIAQLLRIFANTYGADKGIGSSTENKRIDNFLSKEVTKIVQALASDSSGPAQDPFPDSLKQHVKNLLLNKETDNNTNNKKWMEDLK
jgi:hypothetical protein